MLASLQFLSSRLAINMLLSHIVLHGGTIANCRKADFKAPAVPKLPNNAHIDTKLAYAIFMLAIVHA
jgi:hypothetical protein